MRQSFINQLSNTKCFVSAGSALFFRSFISFSIRYSRILPYATYSTNGIQDCDATIFGTFVFVVYSENDSEFSNLLTRTSKNVLASLFQWDILM